MNRRTLLRGGAALGALGGLVGIADLAAHATRRTVAPSDRLRVGYLPITDAAPLLVAHGSGLFDATGAGVERPVRFRGWASLAEAFLSRQVDVVHLLMPFAVQLRYSLGEQVRILAWNHTNGSSLTVRRDIRSLDELAGRRVAIPYWWSIHNIVLQDVLRRAGLRPVVREEPSAAAGTVELVVMSPADMVPALDSGSIGGYVVADPFNAVAEIKGIGRIHRFIGDVWRDHACCVVLAHQDLLDGDPLRVQALVDSIALAQLSIEQDRGRAARVLSGDRYLPQPLPAITRALTYDGSGLHHPEWSGQRIGFQPFPFPGYTAGLIRAMHGTAVDGDTAFLRRIDPDLAHGQLVDDRFVRRSIDRLGGPAAFGLPHDLHRTEEVNPA
ncbi:ABC transporter substrate-binding protein [Saccharopolyspora indica]|uniref:ABC transporter substrate-binding protein n=1 Tax=Saccharopolyspora indica TaxID=1229659 RepID=UPI0022EAF1F2|nr:ABC transporter substrate-binding protein [Saccharopolyspora indica]MDA3643914.1 ABC transporter substrate-binding protein [Saccharopolyspora indica]